MRCTRRKHMPVLIQNDDAGHVQVLVTVRRCRFKLHYIIKKVAVTLPAEERSSWREMVKFYCDIHTHTDAKPFTTAHAGLTRMRITVVITLGGGVPRALRASFMITRSVRQLWNRLNGRYNSVYVSAQSSSDAHSIIISAHTHFLI